MGKCWKVLEPSCIPLQAQSGLYPGELTFAPLPGLQHLAYTKGVSPTLRDARRLTFPASLAAQVQLVAERLCQL